MTTPTGHSPLGASAAHRWLMCPGSVKLSEGLESESSSFALEGTAAHKLAELCLSEADIPARYLGTEMLEGYIVTEEMAEAVEVFCRKIWKVCRELGNIPPDVEKLFHLNWLDEQLWGMNDASVGISFDTLHVWDYKHGAGIPVDVEYQTPVVYASGGQSNKNPQLMYYALGAVGEGNPNNYVDVELGVVQPRAVHPAGSVRTCKVPLPELIAWQEEVLMPGVALTRVAEPSLCAGDHCRFCPAKRRCPELVNQVATVTGLTAAQVFGEDEGLVLPNPEDLTPVQRVKVYELATALDAWIGEVKKDTSARVLAGQDLPGLKAVKGRKSRSWLDSAEGALAKSLGDNAYDKKLKSPAQVEKYLKSVKAEDTHMFDAWVETKTSTVVALESDKRPAICIETAAEVFSGDQ